MSHQIQIVYLIGAYQNPEHLGRLTKALAPSSDLTIVHVSAGVDELPFRQACCSDTVFASSRINGQDGETSIADIALLLAKEAIAILPTADYFIFISGACYPVRSAAGIRAFFQAGRGREFIDAVPDVYRHLRHVFRRRSVYLPTHNQHFRRWLWVMASRHLPLPVAKWFQDGLPIPLWRKWPDGLVPHCGSSWWALSRGALEYCFAYINSHLQFYEYFRHIYGPDEQMLQTILANSPYADKLAGSLTYCDWWCGGKTPGFLDMSKIPILKDCINGGVPTQWGAPGQKCEVLFARKFGEHSQDVLDWIDNMIATPQEKS